jgi:hypothetical protein
MSSHHITLDQILQKASFLREAAELSRQGTLEQLELYKAGLSSAQDKLQAAVGEIRRGNEAIQQLQQDVQACRGKIQSKNEVIRKQEALVKELRTRVAESAREEGQLKDAALLGGQRRELLERELSTAKASIAEGAEIIQKNQEVIAHLNDMINSLQLGGGGGRGGGGGMGGWASPVRPSRSEQQQQQQQEGGEPGHYMYQATEQQQQPPMGSPAGHAVQETEEAGLELYRSPLQASHLLEASKTQHSRKLVHEVSPDSVTYGVSDDIKFNQTHHQHQHQQQYQHQHQQRTSRQIPSQRFSLSPQHLQNSYDLDDHSSAPGQKGYYDGVLDPRLLAPSHGEQHNSPSPSSTQHIPGITRSNRQAKATSAPYSWQLDDFGRE